MRILSFSYCFPNRGNPNWGIFVRQRLAALARRHDVQLDVVAPVPVFPVLSRFRSKLPPAQDIIEDLTVHYPRFFYLPKIFKSWDGRLYGCGLTGWVRELCGDNQPDILDAHFVWPDGVGVSHIAKALDIPYTITLRGAVWVYFLNERIKRQCVDALHGASAIISLSQSMVDACTELGVPREKFTVVHNGVDRTLFRLGDKHEARRGLGLPPEGRLLVCVSYIQKRKGIMELVRAVGNLPQDVRLLIIGAQVSTEADFYHQVLREIDALGLAQRVTLIGQQPHDTIPDYFRAADASVLASYWEGCPNAVLESLACGTPVIATPVGATPEIIVPGENGQLVPMRDVESLTNGIRMVLDGNWIPNRLSESVKSWDEVAANAKMVLTDASGTRLRCW